MPTSHASDNCWRRNKGVAGFLLVLGPVKFKETGTLLIMIMIMIMIPSWCLLAGVGYSVPLMCPIQMALSLASA